MRWVLEVLLDLCRNRPRSCLIFSLFLDFFWVLYRVTLVRILFFLLVLLYLPHCSSSILSAFFWHSSVSCCIFLISTKVSMISLTACLLSLVLSCCISLKNRAEMEVLSCRSRGLMS